jgi:hypothetical protein
MTTMSAGTYTAPATPSSTKTKARTLLEKLDGKSEPDVFDMQSLYQLSLFSKNRRILLDTDIIAKLAAHLEFEYSSRILQLYAQDGLEMTKMMLDLQVPQKSLSMLTADGASFSLRMALVGLIYWLAQDPSCKAVLISNNAAETISQVSATNVPDDEVGAMFRKFVNYSLNALSPETKSRAELKEMLEKGQIPAINTVASSSSSTAATTSSSTEDASSGAQSNGSQNAENPQTPKNEGSDEFRTPASEVKDGRKLEYEQQDERPAEAGAKEEGKEEGSEPVDAEQAQDAQQGQSSKKKRKNKK